MHFLNGASVGVVTAGEVTVVVSQPSPKKHKQKKNKQKLNKTVCSIVVNRLTAGEVSVVVYFGISKMQEQKETVTVAGYILITAGEVAIVVATA